MLRVGTESRVLFGITAIAVLVFLASSTVSAGPLQDIPEAFGDALGTTEYVAKMILSLAILGAFTMLLAVLQMHPVGIVFSMISMIALFVAIGWLDAWILFTLCVVTVVAFATVGSGWFSKQGA